MTVQYSQIQNDMTVPLRQGGRGRMMQELSPKFHWKKGQVLLILVRALHHHVYTKMAFAFHYHSRYFNNNDLQRLPMQESALLYMYYVPLYLYIYIVCAIKVIHGQYIHIYNISIYT